jgi:hypothetical protein
MAFSLYAYLSPIILDKNIPYWQNYFAEQPWLKEPIEDGTLFVHVKPRLENGLERFKQFMDGVLEAKKLGCLVELHSDRWVNPSPEEIKELMFSHGYLDLIDDMVFA